MSMQSVYPLSLPISLGVFCKFPMEIFEKIACTAADDAELQMVLALLALHRCFQPYTREELYKKLILSAKNMENVQSTMEFFDSVESAHVAFYAVTVKCVFILKYLNISTN